jgi:hypothetical protein
VLVPAGYSLRQWQASRRRLADAVLAHARTDDRI